MSADDYAWTVSGRAAGVTETAGLRVVALRSRRSEKWTGASQVDGGLGHVA